MLPAMTPAVARAVDAARGFAAVVEPVQLLHGLLDVEDGRGADLARQAGLDYGAYLAARGEPGVEEGQLSAGSEALIYLAREVAYELTGDGTVGSESLLLTLVREDADVATHLQRLGFDVAQFQAILDAERPPALPLEEPMLLADLTEQGDLARILDASANRGREALRVVEDYCRFTLEDAFLTGQLKELRHGLAGALDEQGPRSLLEARDTAGDVGTAISLDSERERASLREVVVANCKRLQEALRSIEEFAKVSWPLLAERVEQLRYRAYTLERAVLLGTSARQVLRNARLYVLLSSSTCEAGLDWTIAEAAAGGASIVQLREKDLADRELVRRARDVRRWTRQAGVLFIVNDRPDVARLVEADGVHLGQDDVSVKDARRIVGPDAIVGVSSHSLDQLRTAVLDGATYVGVGPVFPSGTKAFSELAGLEFVRAAFRETTLPAFAIGGIDEDNITQVIAAGARGVAVSGAIGRSDDPRRVAANLVQSFPS